MNPDLIEKSIECEEWREYDIPGRSAPYRIWNPKTLVTRVGGTTHRIVEHDGLVHCLPAPGINGCVLRWRDRDVSVPVKF